MRLPRSLCLCFVLLVLHASAASAQYSKLVVFGDSLSDTGNIASVTINFPFPFFQNRITDGPVVADRLATALGLDANASLHLDNKLGGFNYAVGGANIKGNDREDLIPQIDAFLTRVSNQADPSALYFVMIGGNDVRGVRSIRSSAQAQQEMDSILSIFMQQLQRLLDAGARAIVLSNVANIGLIPETIEREASDPGVRARAASYTQYFNQALASKVASLARTNKVQITQFDVSRELENLIVNQDVYGFSQVEEGCFSLSGFDFHPDCVFGTRFDRFIFFDNIHPTSKTNRLVAEALIRALPSNPFRPPTVNVAPIISLILSDS